MSISSVNVTVPATGDGPIADISSLVGQKTVELSGTFVGSYVILGSLDGISFVPILEFESNGDESIELSLPIAIRSVRVRSNAQSPNGVTANITALSSGGTNYFTTLGALPVGTTGPQPVLDTLTVFPSGLETNINYQCVGNFVGLITVEGSMDGVNFNPIGGFRAYEQPPSLLGLTNRLEFSPIASNELTRYVRLVVEGRILSTVTITMGGAIFTSIAPPSGGSGVLIGTDRESSVSDNTEVIILEEYVDLEFLAANVTPHIEGIGIVSANPGVCVLRLYVGATAPGNTAGSTMVVLSSTAALVETTFGGSGAPIANPGGRRLLQITLQQPVAAPGVSATVRGYTGGLS